MQDIDNLNERITELENIVKILKEKLDEQLNFNICCTMKKFSADQYESLDTDEKLEYLQSINLFSKCQEPFDHMYPIHYVCKNENDEHIVKFILDFQKEKLLLESDLKLRPLDYLFDRNNLTMDFFKFVLDLHMIHIKANSHKNDKYLLCKICKHSTSDIMEQFIQFCLDNNNLGFGVYDDYRNQPIHYVCVNKHSDEQIIKTMIETYTKCNIAINIVDLNKNQIIHLICAHKCHLIGLIIFIFETYIKLKLNLNCENVLGFTPIKYLFFNGDKCVIEYAINFFKLNNIQINLSDKIAIQHNKKLSDTNKNFLYNFINLGTI